ncbi:activator of 90 kDa heat shock protein ATPase homolog 1 [Anabrus simplex]|uniref:activator of 90 kDa heat shock protein ATPase homolog 1 n=1 Tax=Anabrus simplex TaxID=316456 RepID=UPI0034DD7D59
MAKWGEGDPRWIVEERPDATNVNNWHWTEKNACAWSIDKLKELLENHTIETDKAKVKITEVKCDGEAVVNNRKGKLIFFYEWDITMKWTGSLAGGEKTDIEGSMNIPNLSEENDVSEVDISVSVKNSDLESDKLKEILLKEGKENIRTQLSKYLVALKEEFTKGMILPKKDDAKVIANLTSGFNKQVHMDYVEKPKTEARGLKIDTTTLQQTHKFQCTAEEIYNVLTMKEFLQAFTQGPVKVDATKGGKFEFFGGNIHGEFVELVPNQKIVQRWRLKRWPAEHYSNVTMTIEQKNDHTELRLKQTGIPSSEVDTTKVNWERYYWTAIKVTFGYGSFVM